MPTKKILPASSTAEPAPSVDSVIMLSQIPSPFRFPLVVIVSLSFSILLNTFTAELIGPELANVSRSLNEGWQVTSVLAWKVLELGISYFSGFDYIDVAALTTLTHLPHLHLLHTFYQIPLQHILAQYVFTLASIILPFVLFGARSAVHTPPARSTSAAKSIPQDPYIGAYTVLLASAVYTLTLHLSFQTWLPAHLIVHFDGVKSLAPAHRGMLLFFVATVVPIGLAAREFLFTPAVHPTVTAADPNSPEADFDPETATLAETIAYNLYLPPATAALAYRIALLTLWTGANTWFQAWVSIKGAEGLGALGWAGVWAGAAAACGAVLGWVGDVA